MPKIINILAYSFDELDEHNKRRAMVQKFMYLRELNWTDACNSMSDSDQEIIELCKESLYSITGDEIPISKE